MHIFFKNTKVYVNLKKNMCVCVCVCVYKLNHFAVHLKLTHCKSTILHLKKIVRSPVETTCE